MPRQLSIFDPPPVPCDPRLPVAMKPRLSRQCQAILARLREGPASNRELAQLAMKYSGRISEIRQAGYDVRCVEHDHATGVAVYVLREDV